MTISMIIFTPKKIIISWTIRTTITNPQTTIAIIHRLCIIKIMVYMKAMHSSISTPMQGDTRMAITATIRYFIIMVVRDIRICHRVRTVHR